MIYQKFIVQGRNRLQGAITPSGNKNEALPILAACLLTKEAVLLKNIPHIKDIQDLQHLLTQLGVCIKPVDTHTLEVHAKEVTQDQLSLKHASRIRGSFLLAGAMLARLGSVKLPVPGGDRIGIRPLDTHLDALEKLGATITFSEDKIYSMRCTQLTGCDLHLNEASVMATENLLMASVLAEGRTTIYHAACEPHVQGLCHFLNSLGARISGIGTNKLEVIGVNTLHGGEYTIQPDHIEVGSFIGLAAATSSDLLIKEAGVHHLHLILEYFKRLGVKVKVDENALHISAKQGLSVRTGWSNSIPQFSDSVWPAFPADLMSILLVLATQCHGTLLIHERLFESRLYWIDHLIGMGAKIVLCDPHRAVISGPTLLHGSTVVSPDIRAGMALLIAAMCAEGQTTIHNVHQIDRGYEAIDTRLNALGASIERLSD